jgi:hypothetical protein
MVCCVTGDSLNSKNQEDLFIRLDKVEVGGGLDKFEPTSNPREVRFEERRVRELGETYYEPDVVERIQSLIQSLIRSGAEPVTMMETPVYQLE